MKVLGTLSHETKSGSLAIRGNENFPQVPSIYSYAGTKKTRVGKIRDIIGPKSRPYIIIKPVSKVDISSLKNETFYEFSRSEHVRKKRNSVRKKDRVHR